MSTHKKRLIKSFWTSGLFCALFSPVMQATAIDIFDKPLTHAGVVAPNVFFMLDDSGSMDWEILTVKHWRSCDYNSNYGGVSSSTDCTTSMDDDGLWPAYSGSSTRNYEYIYSSDNAYANGCSSGREALYSCNSNINSTPYQSDWRILSSDFNVMYYNPALTYEPWLGPCLTSGTNCADANYTAARSNPREGEAGYTVTRNLSSTPFVYELWQDDKGYNTADAKPRRGTNINVTTDANNLIDLWDSHTKISILPSGDAEVSVISYNPAVAGLNPTIASTTTLNATDCHPLLGDGHSPTSSYPGCRTVAQAKQNIANWHQYYRKRSYVAKGAIANVITNNSGFRYGFHTINSAATFKEVPAASVMGFQAHNRAILAELFQFNWPAEGTPLLTGLERAGNYYDNTDGRADPIINQCQKCFTILFTDGYWNGSAPTNASIADNDKDTYADTLADVAKYFYDTDLSTLANVVPADAFDTKTTQHMTTFTVAFGVTGNLIDTDDNGWPNPALTENSNWGMPCDTCTATNIDDLWHAAFNSKGRYISAKNPEEVAQGLADAIADITNRVSSGASIATSSEGTREDSPTFAFIPKYDALAWSGALVAKEILKTGELGSEVWTASVPTPTARNIITHNGTAAVNFTWANLSTTQQSLLNTDISGATDTLGSDRLSYLRGDRTKEGSTFRARPLANVLGDFVNSRPVAIFAPKETYSNSMEGASYNEFRLSNDEYSERPYTVYIGGNDGMLHGFDATTGVEKLAYIPSFVYKNLSALTSQSYPHRFYVDGSPTVKDAYIEGAWRTVLVGGLNKGGQGIYALDVTSPQSFGTADVLWEFTDSDLGYTYSQPSIVKMQDGGWYAIFGNGYNNTEADGSPSASGTAILYIVDLATGALKKKIDTGAGTTANPNGLSTAYAADINGDNIVDAIYAGDLEGNLWKFDVSDSNPLSWQVAFTDAGKPAPLYVATDAGGVRQPITTAPVATTGPRGEGVVVIFGTGQYLGTSDLTTTQIQAMYGIIDKGEMLRGKTQLLQQTIDKQYWDEFCVNPDDKSTCTTWEIRMTSQYALDPATHKGWYMDIKDPNGKEQGERFIGTIQVRDARLIFNTFVPDQGDQCTGGGSSWFMEIDPRSGTRLTFPVFDLNGDGVFDVRDLRDRTDVVSGIREEVKGKKKRRVSSPTIIMCGEEECKYSTTADGEVDLIKNKPPFNIGRQSWRQLK